MTDATLLSFDSSTKDTGCAVFKNGKYDHSLVIDVSAEKNSDVRIDSMIRSIYALIDDLKPFAVVAELTSVARNVDTQRKLTMILGAIKGKCIENNTDFYAYRPSEWRSLVRNEIEKVPRKRQEQKQWALDKCHELGYENVIDDNEAEAILIGMAYIKQMNEFVESEE